MRRLLVLAIVLPVAACAGGRKPAPAPSTPTVPPSAVTAVPSPFRGPAPSTAMLIGGWSRPITGGSGREGFVLAPDGRLGLIGIFTMDGAGWRLEGDSLLLWTGTERYLAPEESRLHVDELTPGRLELSGQDYLAGTWERRDYRSITGTVIYRQRIALTPEAIVQVELRDVSRQDGEASLLARQIIRRPGQAPIAFVLDYDPASIEAGHSYAVSARIADRGQLQFVTDARIPVLTDGATGSTEILVVPVR